MKSASTSLFALYPHPSLRSTNSVCVLTKACSIYAKNDNDPSQHILWPIPISPNFFCVGQISLEEGLKDFTLRILWYACPWVLYSEMNHDALFFIVQNVLETELTAVQQTAIFLRQ